MAKIVKVVKKGTKKFRVELDTGEKPLLKIPEDGNVQAFVGREWNPADEVGGFTPLYQFSVITTDGVAVLYQPETGLVIAKQGQDLYSFYPGGALRRYWSKLTATLKAGEEKVGKSFRDIQADLAGLGREFFGVKTNAQGESFLINKTLAQTPAVKAKDRPAPKPPKPPKEPKAPEEPKAPKAPIDPEAVAKAEAAMNLPDFGNL